MKSGVDLGTASLHFTILYLAMIVISGLFFGFREMQGKKKKRCIFVLSAILFVIMAFRGKDLGNDTENYIILFDQLAALNSPIEYVRESATETAYLLYCWILSRVIPDARILFFVSALFIVGSLGRFANKHVNNVGLFYSILVGMMQFDFLLSGIRQSIALAILFWAFDFLLERKTLPYYVLCTLATMFHTSALLFFLIYPLFSHKIMERKGSFLFNAVLFAAAFGSGFVMDKILTLVIRFLPKYSYYVGTELLDGKPRLAVFLEILIFLLLFIVPSVVWKEPAKDLRRRNAGRQMSMLNLLIILIAANAVALMRFSPLFAFFAIMYYCNETERVKARITDRIWLIMFTLVAFYMYGMVRVVFKTPEWQSTYPIQLSLWINK